MSWCHCGICQSGRTQVWAVAVDQYGAKGDGVTDDRASIQGAIDDVSLNRHGGIVIFPPGNYVIGDTLHLNPSNVDNGRVTLLGAGATTSLLRGPIDRPTLEIGDGITYRRYLTVERLTFTRSSVGTDRVIRARRINQFKFLDCAFAGGEISLDLSEAQIGEVRGNTFGDNVVDYFVQLANSELVSFIANYFERTPAAGQGQHIHLAPGSNRTLIVGNRFNSCVVAIEAAGGPSDDVLVGGNIIEQADNGLRVAGGGARWIFAGNSLRGNSVALTDGILIDGATGCVVVGNKVLGFANTIRDTSVLGTSESTNVYDVAPDVHSVATIAALVAGTISVLTISNLHIGLGGADNLTAIVDGKRGQEVTLYFDNGNCTLINGLNLALRGGVNVTPILGQTLVFKFDGATWWETSRNF